MRQRDTEPEKSFLYKFLYLFLHWAVKFSPSGYILANRSRTSRSSAYSRCITAALSHTEKSLHLGTQPRRRRRCLLFLWAVQNRVRVRALLFINKYQLCDVLARSSPIRAWILLCTSVSPATILDEERLLSESSWSILLWQAVRQDVQPKSTKYVCVPIMERDATSTKRPFPAHPHCHHNEWSSWMLW